MSNRADPSHLGNVGPYDANYDDDEPAIVCFDTEAGYAPGNIEMVSGRAARLIDFSQDFGYAADELRKAASWLEEHGSA